MNDRQRKRFLEFLGSGFKIPGLVDTETGEVKVGDKDTIDKKIRMETVVRLANDPACDGVWKDREGYSIKITREDFNEAGFQ